MSDYEELRSRDGAAVMAHHQQMVVTRDVERIMGDYDEHLIAINNLDGTTRIIRCADDLRVQVAAMMSEEVDETAAAIEPSILLYRGEGNYMVSSGSFDPVIPFAAYTYIVRDGLAVYVTGYSKELTKLDGEPAEVQPPEVKGETLLLVEQLLHAYSAGDAAAAASYYAEDAVVLTNLVEETAKNRSDIEKLYQVMMGGVNPRASKPRYTVYEEEEALAFFVYENEQGITEETYLVKEGAIQFASIVHRGR